MSPSPLKPRKIPTQSRAISTVDALLEATAQVLLTEGYAKASTNKIARRAGVSIGSLYQYFPNKDALILALLDQFADRQQALLVDQLSRVDAATSRDFIRETLTALLRVHHATPELARVLYQQVPRTGQFDLVDRWTRRSQEVIRQSLEPIKELVRPRDLELASYVLVTAFHGVVHQAVFHRPELLEDDRLIDEMTELVSRYLLP